MINLLAVVTSEHVYSMDLGNVRAKLTRLLKTLQ